MVKGHFVRFSLIPIVSGFILAMALPALAGAPFTTDDPEPTPYRGYEILLASDYARSADGTAVTMPHLEFNYGIMPNVSVTATLPLAGAAVPNGPFYVGYGDTQLQVKARIIQETKHFPQIAVGPTVVLPSGDANKNLGGGYETAFYPVWFEKNVGKYTVYGGGGYWHNPGDGNKDYTFTGVALLRDMGHGLSLGTELFGQSANTVNGTSSLGFNVGAIRELDEHHELLSSLGRSLHGPNTFSAYAAYGWVLGPHDKSEPAEASPAACWGQCRPNAYDRSRNTQLDRPLLLPRPLRN